MQVLYQIDVNAAIGDREPSQATILEGLDETNGSPEAREAAVDWALAAWAEHADADAAVTELAPDWPTHRQPPVDRAILRLAYAEMRQGRNPIKIAINEAVELAKQFGAEQSPPFINGVLDKIAKRLGPVPTEPAKATNGPQRAETAQGQ